MDEAWLEKIVEKYPCFHGAHLLKGIYLKQEDEKGFEEALPNIAIRVNNRAVLYDRVHEKYDDKEKTVKKKVVKAPIWVEEKEVNTEKNDDLKALVQAIRTKRTEQPIKSKVERKAKNIESTVNKNVSKVKTDKKKAPKKKKVATPKVQETGSFTDWLKHQKPVDSTQVEVPIDPTASNEAELHLEAKRSSFKLEDFLVNQIQRKQVKKEGRKGGFTHTVSETYAKILVDQGNIDEAIAIYKELSIKYPKKSSTFARQIENLKSS